MVYILHVLSYVYKRVVAFMLSDQKNIAIPLINKARNWKNFLKEAIM